MYINCSLGNEFGISKDELPVAITYIKEHGM